MRNSIQLRHKMPKNINVAPRYDIWNEKYEPWLHMKRMGRLVGTGFYIPPEWYNHFRMFPPINHNFQEEKTLNPQNRGEPTQDGTDTLSAERWKLREELGQRSRSLAAEGMRYYNLFWIRKPLEEMEKQYYIYKGKGLNHDGAIRRTLQDFYSQLATRKRAGLIQSEEARLSGEFISMREAATVISALAHLQKHDMTPHQVSALATEKRQQSTGDQMLRASIEPFQRKVAKQPKPVETSPAEKADEVADSAAALSEKVASDATAAAADGGSATAEATKSVEEAEEAPPFSHAVLFEELSGGDRAVVVTTNPNDTIAKLRSQATGDTGDVEWFSGEGPSYPTS